MSDLRQRVLLKKAERNDLRRELKEIEAGAQGDLMAISGVVDGFTDLVDMNLDIAMAQLKELKIKQRKAQEIKSKLNDIERFLNDIGIDED